MPELTTDQVRERFLRSVWGCVDSWERECRADKSLRERLEGLAFSILAMLDGSNIELPQFIVAPDPHPGDREYHEERRTDWFPENHELTESVRADISGCLHELFHEFKPRTLDGIFFSPELDLTRSSDPKSELQAARTIWAEIRADRWLRIGDDVYQILGEGFIEEGRQFTVEQIKVRRVYDNHKMIIAFEYVYSALMDGKHVEVTDQ